VGTSPSKLTRRGPDLWLREEILTVEHAGEPLSAYEVDYDAAGGRGESGRLLEVRKPTLFETSLTSRQLRLFSLTETLGEEGWLQTLRLDDYAPRRPRPPVTLQQVLFPYTRAI
jgi:hypothetical protein